MAKPKMQKASKEGIDDSPHDLKVSFRTQRASLCKQEGW